MVCACLAIGAQAIAQDSPVKFSGYLETYYGYDFNKPQNHNRPAFIYSHNRHNEVNLNIGYLKGSFDNDRVRANLAIMAGTYANANMAAEEGVLKNIYEANAGVKLGKAHAIWLDAGILPSHIGFESAVSKDCWALTRNIGSENTPYFETGARLSYKSADDKWAMAILYLNGWQRIVRVNGSSKPAGGLQISYSANDITLNYSNYLGKEGADSTGLTRFYNNFYGIFKLTEQFGITLGFDYGRQQKIKGSTEYNDIYSVVGLARYAFTDQWALAARAEYYSDPGGVMISPVAENGFKTRGYSVNLDYAPMDNALLRLEGKVYAAGDKQFMRKENAVKHNALLTASIAVSF